MPRLMPEPGPLMLILNWAIWVTAANWFKIFNATHRLVGLMVVIFPSCSAVAKTLWAPLSFFKDNEMLTWSQGQFFIYP